MTMDMHFSRIDAGKFRGKNEKFRVFSRIRPKLSKMIKNRKSMLRVNLSDLNGVFVTCLDGQEMMMDKFLRHLFIGQNRRVVYLHLNKYIASKSIRIKNINITNSKQNHFLLQFV